MQRPSVCPCDWKNKAYLPDEKSRAMASDLNFSGVMLTCFLELLSLPSTSLILSYHWLVFRFFHLQSIMGKGLLFIPFLCPVPWKKTLIFFPLQLSAYITLSFYITYISEINYIHNIRIQQLVPQIISKHHFLF